MWFLDVWVNPMASYEKYHLCLLIHLHFPHAHTSSLQVTVDWTMNWTLDSITELEFHHQGQSHMHINQQQSCDIWCNQECIELAKEHIEPALYSWCTEVSEAAEFATQVYTLSLYWPITICNNLHTARLSYVLPLLCYWWTVVHAYWSTAIGFW